MIQRRSGFTIIELMLAMAFISVLLLAIAFTAIQAGRLYNRGIVLSSINQAGRTISDAMRRDFLQSQYRPDFTTVVRQDGEYSSGRFCTGQYSYLWNSPQVLDRQDDRDLEGKNAAIRHNGQPINFVRVPDVTKEYCQPLATGAYPHTIPSNAAVTTLLRTQTSSSDVVLAIHRLHITPLTAEVSREGLYRIEFVIGTSVLTEINTGDQTCKPPSDDQANADFCAINNFDMIVRTNG